MLNPKTSINIRRPANPFNNNDINFPINPILNHPLNSNNSNNFNMNNMNNMNSMNNMNQMNNFNNMNNYNNNMNNINMLNNMSFNNNMNNNMNNMSISNMNTNNNINNFNNMNLNNNMSNMNNAQNINNNMNNLINFNNQNSMIQNPNPQMSQIKQYQNSNQGNLLNKKLQCSLCSNKATKPKMCKFCGQVSCLNCIINWFSNNNNCPNCKTTMTVNDLITMNYDEDMSISGSSQRLNIGKAEKKRNAHRSVVIQKGMQKGNIVFQNILDNNEDNNINYCRTHGNKLEFYCFQCNQYYCSNCLVFFGQDVKKHANHLILTIDKMKDPRIKQLIDEYKKLILTKSNMDNVIGLCNYRLKENYIKNNQFENYLNIIKDSYIKKIDESFHDIDSLLNDLKIQKERIENSIGSIPNGFNNIVNTNDHVQGGIMSEELKKLNKIDPTADNNIRQAARFQPNLFVENYQSELLEIPIPYRGQYNEGLEIINRNMNFIPNHKSNLVIKYLQNKVYFSFSIDINSPINSIDFPKFYCYITIQNQKYGLEFNNLLNQNFPQNIVRSNTGRRNFEQINTNEFDFGQLMFIAGDEKKIKMKIYVMKVYFKN